MYRYFHLYCHFVPFLLLLRKRNITPVTLIGEKEKARIVNTLSKLNLLAQVVQLAALIKRNFPCYLVSGNLQSNCSSQFFQKQVLKDYKSKLFYQILRRRFKTRRRQFCVLYKLHFLKKLKMPNESCFSNITLQF